MAPEAPRGAVRAENLCLKTKQENRRDTTRGWGAPISISPVLSNLQRRYILGRIQSDLRSPSSISNLQRRHLRPDSVRSPISISNLQSPISIRGPGGGGGLKPSRRCNLDSFTLTISHLQSPIFYLATVSPPAAIYDLHFQSSISHLGRMAGR